MQDTFLPLAQERYSCRADFPETAPYEVVCLFPVGVPAAQPGPNHGKRLSPAEFASELA